jgi:glutathione synthase
MSLKIAVQMDAFARLDVATDSTLCLMRAAYERDYRLFVYQPADLRSVSDGKAGRICARGAWVTHWQDATRVPELGAEEVLDLSLIDVLLMRQDPPFDMAYVTATYLLELLPPHVLFVNHPRAVRDAPEKIFIARYPHLQPPTLIATESAAIRAFAQEHGTLVLKPLYGFGASGVIMLNPDDPTALLEGYRHEQNGLPFIAQKFLPQVAAGDKRVLLLDGQILGTVNRVPQPGAFLANLHAGGRAEATAVTPQEKALVMEFAGDLAARGIFLAGVDIIGDKITEINVTCPSTIVDANQANGLQGAARLEEKFWDAVAHKCRISRP